MLQGEMVLKVIFSQLPSWKLLMFCHLLSAFSRSSVTAAECEGGRSEVAAVTENSSMGTVITNLSFSADPSTNHITLSLSGKDADWFYLEGKTVRLNSSTKVLDRETYNSVLTATVKCYEHDILQAEHRIMVEVLNENDNRPVFQRSSIQPLTLSELTAVNTVVFTVKATDADGDTLTYIIDKTSPDASYFRVDLPNSGRVVLSKSLDYESKTQIQLTLYAVESNTKEHYNTSATLIINVTDGDDHYPRFQPCILLSANHSNRICANPLYTANITENEQDIVLDFFPGPIQAEDGDRGLRTPITYTILSGADNGRFVINSSSGEVRLTRCVENRLLTPTLRLRVMAAQVDDPLKYAVATVLVRVLAENRYPPQFKRSVYRGFISESTSPASLVLTFSYKLLTLQAEDRDFTDGFNPRLQYSLTSENNSSRLFYVTQEGLLIAKTNQLHPHHKYFLEAVATDLESGDTVKADLLVEVLQKGQPVPQGPLGAGHPDGRQTVGRTEGLAGVCLILLGVTLFILVWCVRRRRKRRDPAVRASVAENKHPNVMNHGRQMPLVEESLCHSEALSRYDCSTLPCSGTQGIYTQTEKPATPTVNFSPMTFNMPSTDPETSAPRPNGRPADRSNTKSVSFHDFVVVRECETITDTVAENTEAEEFNSTDSEEITTESDVAEDQNVTGLPTESQRFTDSEDSDETEFKKGITEESSDTTGAEAGKLSTVHANTEELANHHITALEMLEAVISGEEQAGDSYGIGQKEDTSTQNITDVMKAEEPNICYPEAVSDDISRPSDDISRPSDDISRLSNPPESVTEKSIKQTEAAEILHSRFKRTEQDTDAQNLNITAQEETNAHQLSSMNLDSTQHNGSKQTLQMINTTTHLHQASLNTYNVNEGIKTNSDNISSEEFQQSLYDLDVSSQGLNYLVTTKLDMNMQVNREY